MNEITANLFYCVFFVWSMFDLWRHHNKILKLEERVKTLEENDERKR